MERRDESEGLFCTGLFGVCRSRRSRSVRAPWVGVSVMFGDVLMGLCGVCGTFDGRIDFRGSVLISSTVAAVLMIFDSSSVSNFLFLKFVEGLSNSVTVTDTPSTFLFLSMIDFAPPFVLAFEIVVKEVNGLVLVAAAFLEVVAVTFLFLIAEGMIVIVMKARIVEKCKTRTIEAKFVNANKLRLQK